MATAMMTRSDTNETEVLDPSKETRVHLLWKIGQLQMLPSLALKAGHGQATRLLDPAVLGPHQTRHDAGDRHAENGQQHGLLAWSADPKFDTCSVETGVGPV